MIQKEELLKQLAEIYAGNPTPDLVDIYWRLMLILNDLRVLMENKKSG